MRCPIILAQVLLAIAGTVTVAGSQPLPVQPDLSLSGRKEFGLFPTGRYLSTEFSVDKGRSAFGGTATLAAHLRSYLALEGALGVAYSRQEFSYYKPPLYTITPTLSFVLQRGTSNATQPYLIAGGGYEMVRHTKATCGCEQSHGMAIGHGGAGFRRMLGDSRAFRAELTTQIGKGVPTYTGFAGFSVFTGGGRPVRRKGLPRPPERVRIGPRNIPPGDGREPIVRPRPEANAPRPGTPGPVLMTLNGTQVDFSNPLWRRQAERALDGLAAQLNRPPEVRTRIFVEAHTDDVGSNAANTMLGLDRAKSVREYLIARGVSADRIHIVSHGEDKPVASTSTPAGRQQNRRIVIRREI